jgi:hypothetical protein
MNDEVGLTEQFRQLGVKNPELWAKSQIKEGVNQLSRARALTMMWSGVQKYEDRIGIRSETKTIPDPNSPFGVYGYILSKMLKSGISEIEILYIIRCIQSEFITHIAQCSDGCNDDALISGVRICDVDEDNNEVCFPDGLHESVLEFDKDEMRAPKELLEVLNMDTEFLKQVRRLNSNYNSPAENA